MFGIGSYNSILNIYKVYNLIYCLQDTLPNVFDRPVECVRQGVFNPKI
jgi:hypothetical protein